MAKDSFSIAELQKLWKEYSLTLDAKESYWDGLYTSDREYETDAFDRFMDWLKERAENLDKDNGMPFRVGDIVRVIGGSVYLGSQGIVDAANGTRVIVYVHIGGPSITETSHKTAASFNSDDLELIGRQGGWGAFAQK